MQWQRIGAHSCKLCDTLTDSDKTDSDTSSDEEQPDADASTNAVVETVATPDSDMNDCNVYIYHVALSRLWHVVTSVFVRPAQTTWMSHLPHRHPNDPVSFLTFSWDTWTVHLQVDLDEFGVADFVPISTRFCMLSVCYCIILHAGCFLRTFLVLIFLHCCMFYNDWRTMSFRFFAASAFHNSWSRVFHPRMMVPRFPVPRFQSPRSFVTDNIFEVGW